MFKPIFFGLIFYIAVAFFLADAQIKTSFSCEGRGSGYYADVTTGCQVYHMCDGLGRKFSFSCPNATLFQQRMLICDHWFMVNCSKSESEYGANLLIGQRGKPFVDDSGQASFQRTPRPDYAMKNSEKNNAIYQNRVEPLEDTNQVGGNSNGNQDNSNEFNLPSRWSTEYNKVAPTADPKQQFSNSNDEATHLNRLNNFNTKIPYLQRMNKFSVNYESRFKATTPVYPTFVNESLKLADLDLAPPRIQPPLRIEDINNLQSTDSYEELENNPVVVNFQSNYKATTPVYPTYVDVDSKFDNLELSLPKDGNMPRADVIGKASVNVNFHSNFKATTPVYPTSVDENLKLNNLELFPPILQPGASNTATENRNKENISNGSGSASILVNFPSDFKATTPVYPTSVDDALKNNNFELLSPLPQNVGEDVQVNFESNFKATTPVYPLSVEATSPIPDKFGLLPPIGEVNQQHQLIQEFTTRAPVNFESNFLATVPNYPASVEATSPNPDAVGLLPPNRNDPAGRFLNFQPKDEIDQINPSKDGQSPQISQYYEPPLYDVGFVDPNGALATYRSHSQHVVSPNVEDWNDLRRKLFVPEFEFPLDSAAKRASYDSDLSSFQPRPAGLQKR